MRARMALLFLLSGLVVGVAIAAERSGSDKRVLGSVTLPAQKPPVQGRTPSGGRFNLFPSVQRDGGVQRRCVAGVFKSRSGPATGGAFCTEGDPRRDVRWVVWGDCQARESVILILTSKRYVRAGVRSSSTAGARVRRVALPARYPGGGSLYVIATTRLDAPEIITVDRRDRLRSWGTAVNAGKCPKPGTGLMTSEDTFSPPPEDCDDGINCGSVITTDPRQIPGG